LYDILPSLDRCEWHVRAVRNSYSNPSCVCATMERNRRSGISFHDFHHAENNREC